MIATETITPLGFIASATLLNSRPAYLNPNMLNHGQHMSVGRVRTRIPEDIRRKLSVMNPAMLLKLTSSVETDD